MLFSAREWRAVAFAFIRALKRWCAFGLRLIGAAILLLGFASPLRAELVTYVTTDPNSAQNQPPATGGNGWLPTGVSARGTSVPAGQTVWLACKNVYNADQTKVWEVKLTSTGAPGDVSDTNLPSTEQVGFDASGGRIAGQGRFSFFNAITGVRGFRLWFKPQPAWERLALKNTTQHPIDFIIQTSASCHKSVVTSNTFRVPSCNFGAVGPGIMLTNQFIKDIFIFPQTIPIQPAIPPTFSAPSNSGNWTGTFVSVDPDGTNRPLGGIHFSSDGIGLDPSNSCGFSFAMQGPAADLQYTMYAYDDVMQEFQEFDIDLRPSLSLSLSNGSLVLPFGSTLGLNYTLQTSTDLFNWFPLQPFSGTGGSNIDFLPLDGSISFYRLQCYVSTAPVLSAISAMSLSNGMDLIFNESVSGSTALNPGNYFVGSGTGPLMIQNVTQPRSNDVHLRFNSPLLPGTNYTLGVMRVGDLVSNVMTPTSLQFTPVTPQTPCPGGTLIARQTYSECNADGFWHVVEDDYYQCPPGNTVQKVRVADNKTTQPCGSPVPSSIELLYPTAADVSANCPGAVLVGKINILECIHGLWANSVYQLYKCADGTTFLSGPIQNLPVNPPTPCNQSPPPPPPGA
jgi:hypothetical protein